MGNHKDKPGIDFKKLNKETEAANKKAATVIKELKEIPLADRNKPKKKGK